MSGMKAAKGVLAGPKFSNRHSTVIPEANEVVRALRGADFVRKIVVSEIRHASGGGAKRRIKITPIDAGCRVTVRGSSAVQEFFVYTNNRAAVETLLT
mgnify:CR=1 FL=1